VNKHYISEQERLLLEVPISLLHLLMNLCVNVLWVEGAALLLWGPLGQGLRRVGPEGRILTVAGASFGCRIVKSNKSILVSRPRAHLVRIAIHLEIEDTCSLE
jgi:hypothetical protein